MHRLLKQRHVGLGADFPRVVSLLSGLQCRDGSVNGKSRRADLALTTLENQ